MTRLEEMSFDRMIEKLRIIVIREDKAKNGNLASEINEVRFELKCLKENIESTAS